MTINDLRTPTWVTDRDRPKGFVSPDGKPLRGSITITAPSCDAAVLMLGPDVTFTVQIPCTGDPSGGESAEDEPKTDLTAEEKLTHRVQLDARLLADDFCTLMDRADALGIDFCTTLSADGNVLGHRLSWRDPDGEDQHISLEPSAWDTNANVSLPNLASCC